ncbi:adenosylcobalamin-dependent ribonucleoside-diphosphate reductase [Mucisphaera calidilacus]|uniref:Vitamin B12-dependent ribonucleotide reductase n=1 Tax=Mucisphaera calidilacus TaxID=2527982 RepID=A0A518BV15_9BACT|nr:adenosylcobalamin-dependent ribonucleoside-diphosphate reductase [Mucisphaera calidilacus]QDU70818.1 Vitamin B12-dependent ribonucleotide reductase [Mucisphaera calidilacus]
MKITRRFTQPGTDVFESIEWSRRSCRIANLDGSVVFEMSDAEIPASWSQLASDIMISKYFRKAGVPADGGPNGLPDPDWTPGGGDTNKEVPVGPEKSARQVIHRLAGCWRHWGERHGYFDTTEDAQAFYDELCYMLLNQAAAPNSPQWFNTGLNWAYGINGPAQGHSYTDPITGQTRKSEDAYTHPQPHACFIQSVQDDLVNEGGIMDLWVREARLFKYGSGTGTNFSSIRGENESLSGGGKSSGLMSFLKIGDRAAGAIKSGGTTRRAAKMVCLDLDHPDIEHFVNWKVREEIKVAALVEGFKAIQDGKTSDTDTETVGETCARLGLTLDYDFNGESYQTVSGQNSNNSVRIPNAFFNAVDNNTDWNLTHRTTGNTVKTMPAADLWAQIGYAAWRCADPGVQFDTTINEWHTCPQSGRINASNPCSEYMFLDNTACNLASLNLLKFYDRKTRTFDLQAYENATAIWTVVLEVSVLMAQYPSDEIAQLSHEYRTLGLGYANLGAMLMQAGIPYDSDRARAISGCLTAILTGRSYATSAAMARQLGPFDGYKPNADDMLRVIRNHRRAAYGVPRDPALSKHHELSTYEGLDTPPVPIDAGNLTSAREAAGVLANADALADHARRAWDDALALGERYGYRNAQVTVIAPTGTIGLLMDCDTTGVEPDFALVKFKKLAGGGYFKIANQSLQPALEALGYSEDQRRAILTYVMGALRLDVPMPAANGTVSKGAPTFAEYLIEKGLDDADLQRLTDTLPTVFEIGQAFTPWTLGEETIRKINLADRADDPELNVLRELGLTGKQINALNLAVCGTQTIEGAPELDEQHLPVFDCANKCGNLGKRYIAPQGHIRMMAAAQPFITGAISKTINLPNDASVDDILAAYRLSWELGLKANALYRDGCKLSQPLNSGGSDTTDDDVLDAEQDDEAVEMARDEVAEQVAAVAAEPEPVIRERIVEMVVERPLRRRLPDTRHSRTHKFNVAGHEGYLTVGLYEDGSPGELFITMAKEGSTIGGLMDSLGTAISVALQYGVPVESLVSKFTHQRFEPAGMTHNPDIPFAKSLVDYIFRWMGMEFVEGYRSANAPLRSTEDTDGQDLPKTSRKMNTIKPAAPSGNGNGHGKPAAQPATETATQTSTAVMIEEQRKPRFEVQHESDRVAAEDNSLDAAMKGLQADAPACDVCGTITVRNGTCYKCLNCGNSMGCS